MDKPDRAEREKTQTRLVDLYHQQAAQCRRAADEAADPKTRERWLKMADAWILLATTSYQ